MRAFSVSIPGRFRIFHRYVGEWLGQDDPVDLTGLVGGIGVDRLPGELHGHTAGFLGDPVQPGPEEGVTVIAVVDQNQDVLLEKGLVEGALPGPGITSGS